MGLLALLPSCLPYLPGPDGVNLERKVLQLSFISLLSQYFFLNSIIKKDYGQTAGRPFIIKDFWGSLILKTGQSVSEFSVF